MQQQRHHPMARGDQDTPRSMTPTRTHGTKMRKMIHHYLQHRATANKHGNGGPRKDSPTHSRHRGTASKGEGDNRRDNMSKGNHLAPQTVSQWWGAQRKLPPSLGNSSRPLSRDRLPTRRTALVPSKHSKPDHRTWSRTPKTRREALTARHHQTSRPNKGSSTRAARKGEPQIHSSKHRSSSRDSSRRNFRKSRSTSRSRPRQHQHKPKPPAVDGDTRQTTCRRSKRKRGSSGGATHSNSKAQKINSKAGERSNTPLLTKSKMTHSKPLNSKKSATQKGDKINKTINVKGERARATTMKVKEINAEETRQRRARFVQNSRGGGSTNPTSTHGTKWRTRSTWYPSTRQRGRAANKLPATGNAMKHENGEIYVTNVQLMTAYHNRKGAQRPMRGQGHNRTSLTLPCPTTRGLQAGADCEGPTPTT